MNKNKDHKITVGFIVLMVAAALMLILYLSIHAAYQQDRIRAQETRIELQEARAERQENTIEQLRAAIEAQADRITYLEDEYSAEGEIHIHRDIEWSNLINFINNMSARIRGLEEARTE